MQWMVLRLIREYGKPMSFAEMRAVINAAGGLEPDAPWRPAFARSMRRALHLLTKQHLLVAMGDGRPGNPYRYFLHPISVGMMGDTPEARALYAALEADPDANRAVADSMARMRVSTAGDSAA
jgi:hypothetical protein